MLTRGLIVHWNSSSSGSKKHLYTSKDKQEPIPTKAYEDSSEYNIYINLYLNTERFILNTTEQKSHLLYFLFNQVYRNHSRT